VRTLHGYARSLLGKLLNRDIHIFSKLTYVIREDAIVLLNRDVDFSKIFHDRDDTNDDINFYAKRKKYYDDFYGHPDVIFALALCLEKRRDKIPSYQQIVVDEFQDFNELEVRFIDLLAEKSPILIAGDDDQALYDFKQASSKHIRRRHLDKNLGFESFELPFCSRCPRVIVKAANDIIRSATENGYMDGRIKKRYEYFEHKDKNAVCDSNPKIAYNHVYANRIPWFIADRIEKISKALRQAFNVLIISPSRNQSRYVATALKKKGFKSVESRDKRSEEPTLLDGLKLLSEDPKSNLGWRIVAKNVLDKEHFESLLKEAEKNGTRAIHELISAEHKSQVVAMTRVINKFKTYAPIEAKHLPALHGMNVDFLEIVRSALTDKLELGKVPTVKAGIRKIHINATTIQSSKGLSADYVFITHFDDMYFIGDDKNKLSDRQICNFLVALTRARNKVFLISSNPEVPTFLKWIDEDRIEHNS
jgi:superfamily I DNA/RNA helicase